MDALRHAHRVAMVMLALQAFALVRTATPASVVCTCSHAPGEGCSCPMHSSASTSPTAEVDESKLPPCHRHKLHAQKPAPIPEGASCVRNGCGMPEPTLTMMLFLDLPEPDVVTLEPVAHPMHAAVPRVPTAPALGKAEPPPRASV